MPDIKHIVFGELQDERTEQRKVLELNSHLMKVGLFLAVRDVQKEGSA